MAGTAPTGSQFTSTLDAGPVHCSVWLARTPQRSVVGPDQLELTAQHLLQCLNLLLRQGLQIGI